MFPSCSFHQLTHHLFNFNPKIINLSLVKTHLDQPQPPTPKPPETTTNHIENHLHLHANLYFLFPSPI